MKIVKRFLLCSIVILFCIAAIYYVYKRNNHIFTSSDEIESTTEIKEEYNEITITNDYKTLDGKINNNETFMLTLGKTGCKFCELYKPVLLKIQNNYDFNYTFIDLNMLSNDDYNALMDSDITIPKKCTDNEFDVPLSNGFGTPLSLIYYKGTIIDCIRGYKDYTTTKNILLNDAIIKD